MMNDNTIVHLVKHLDVTDLAGEKVMIDFATGKYFLLKGSANEIWDMLDQDVTILEIRNSLMNIYDGWTLHPQSSRGSSRTPAVPRQS